MATYGTGWQEQGWRSTLGGGSVTRKQQPRSEANKRASVKSNHCQRLFKKSIIRRAKGVVVKTPIFGKIFCATILQKFLKGNPSKSPHQPVPRPAAGGGGVDPGLSSNPKGGGGAPGQAGSHCPGGGESVPALVVCRKMCENGLFWASGTALNE